MPERNLTNSSDKPGVLPIAFLDSGVGGLPYLQWARERLPGENFVYLADRKHFPYGTKTPEAVFEAVAEGIAKVSEAFAPEIFVLACNTASVVALEKLRREFPAKTFIGTVPAVKPAAKYSKNKRIGILATDGTVHARYLDTLINRFASACTVVRVPGPDIVNFVEKRFFTASAEERLAVIAGAASRFRFENVDTVVLACTHFLYLLEEIHSAMGGGVTLIDSREGVGKRLIDILNSSRPSCSSAQAPPGRARLYLSGGWAPEPQYAFFADFFGLELAGTL
jgi:glutamate racemase